MFKVIVLLESKPLSQSQVFCCILKGFFRYFLSFFFLLHCSTFLSHSEEKHLHNMVMPLPCITIGFFFFFSHDAKCSFYVTLESLKCRSEHSVLVLSDQSTFCNMCAVPSIWQMLNMSLYGFFIFSIMACFRTHKHQI